MEQDDKTALMLAMENISITSQVAISTTPYFGNGSFVSFSQRHSVTRIIEQYTMPVICLLGIIANTLSSIAFLQKPLRNSSCSIFLAVRGFSDNGFLSTLLLIWISSTFDLQLSRIRGLCQINVFLTYVCGCISVWLVVLVTAENYIRICKPFIVNRVCNTTTAKIAVCILIVLAIGTYNFPFWTTNPDCSPKEYYLETIQGMVYTDTLLTLVIPTMCISILMIVIVYNLIDSYKRRGRLSAPTVKRVQNPMAKVTKMLLAVTVTFFCLNLPSHVIRITLMIRSFLSDYKGVSQFEEAIHKVALLVYYMSLSINVIVYLYFGQKFRKVFKQTYCRLNTRQSPSRQCALERTTLEVPELILHKSSSAQLNASNDTVATELVLLKHSYSH